MAAYSLTFKPSVEKDFFKIPQPVSSRILTRIEQLPANPFPPQTSRLQGAERLYRFRVGDYRVVYEVDPEVRAIGRSLCSPSPGRVSGAPLVRELVPPIVVLKCPQCRYEERSWAWPGMP